VEFFLVESTEQILDQGHPPLPAALHQSSALAGSPDQSRAPILRVGPPFSQSGPLETIDDPRHGGTCDLLSIGQRGDGPLSREHENRKGRELPWRDTERRIGGAGSAHEMDRHRVQAGREVPEFSLHQIGSLPILSGMVTDLRQVALHVEDMDRAIAFYRDIVGLDLIVRFDQAGLTFFDLGGTRLLLETGAPSSLLYLGVADVASTTERLRQAGVKIESEPHVIHVDHAGLFGPPGEAEEMSFFRDSESNLVGLAGRRAVAGT
jgi:methylmalonyl-CoA/ethylmalonyl-CoA epimerase